MRGYQQNMQLYFIRHGQSVNNAGWGDPNYQESPDPILTELGTQQAGLLAEYLEKNQCITEHTGWDPHNRYGFGITHMYASLMERAVHTASYTAQKFQQIPFAAWEEIHESGGIFGRDGEMKLKGLPGKPRSWFEANFPQFILPASLDGTGWWKERPQESEDECQMRAQKVWTELLVRHGDRDSQPESRVAFVSHGGFFMHLMCAILNLPWRQASNGLNSWFLLNNCSISRIEVHKDEVTICYLNRTDHLPSHLITG
jgi:2,3-bisphosphoglycerate-dependent phosphoglycerate mutase